MTRNIIFTIVGAYTLLSSAIGYILYSPPAAGVMAGIDILRGKNPNARTWMITASERFILLAFAGSGLRIFLISVLKLLSSTNPSWVDWINSGISYVTVILSALAMTWRLAVYLYYRNWPPA